MGELAEWGRCIKCDDPLRTMGVDGSQPPYCEDCKYAYYKRILDRSKKRKESKK